MNEVENQSSALDSHAKTSSAKELPWHVMVRNAKPKKSNKKKAEVNTVEEDCLDVAAVDCNKGWERIDLTVDSGTGGNGHPHWS